MINKKTQKAIVLQIEQEGCKVPNVRIFGLEDFKLYEKLPALFFRFNPKVGDVGPIYVYKSRLYNSKEVNSESAFQRFENLLKVSRKIIKNFKDEKTSSVEYVDYFRSYYLPLSFFARAIIDVKDELNETKKFSDEDAISQKLEKVVDDLYEFKSNYFDDNFDYKLSPTVVAKDYTQKLINDLKRVDIEWKKKTVPSLEPWLEENKEENENKSSDEKSKKVVKQKTLFEF